MISELDIIMSIHITQMLFKAVTLEQNRTILHEIDRYLLVCDFHSDINKVAFNAYHNSLQCKSLLFL